MFVVPFMTMLMTARTTDVIMRPLLRTDRNDNDSKFPDVDEDNDDFLKVDKWKTSRNFPVDLVS
jgi:hypothetical protein